MKMANIVGFIVFFTLFVPSHLQNSFSHYEKINSEFKDFFSNSKLGRVEFGVDPESYMNVSQLITSKGYPCEDYTVQTPDGFLLDIQRIPYSPRNSTRGRRPVVFLQHGLLCSSASWVINHVNDSLAFILADAGYDVWLGNMRGNTYARRHISLSVTDDAFWAWSMDEMAKYDLPAMVNFTLKKTKQSKLYYVGHSQGTFIGFAQFSHDRVLASKIKMFFALAPVTSVGYTLTPLRLFKFANDTELFNVVGRRDFMPNYEVIKFLARTVCDYKYIRGICVSVIFLFGGIHVQQFDFLIRTYKFQMYDFESRLENLKHYAQPTPPPYNVTGMTVPVVLYTGGHDWLADKKDVALLITKLKSLVSHTYIPNYNHFDFIWGMNAPSKVYSNVIDLMRKHP